MENKIDNEMSESDYRSYDALNYSHLKLMSKPFMYKQMVIEGKKRESTSSMSIGTAVHIKILEPHKAHLIQNLKDHGFNDKRSWQKIRKLEAENPDVLFFTDKEIEAINTMVTSVKLHDEAIKLYTNTWSEVSYFWHDKEYDIQCKARADTLNQEKGYVVDLKTTADAEGFMKEAVKFGYHIQAAFYLRGLKQLTGKDMDWYWVAVDTKSPHFCYVYKMTPETHQIGEYLVDKYITRLAECKRQDLWPIGNEQIKRGALPDWYVSSMVAQMEKKEGKYNEFRDS